MRGHSASVSQLRWVACQETSVSPETWPVAFGLQGRARTSEPRD